MPSTSGIQVSGHSPGIVTSTVNGFGHHQSNERQIEYPKSFNNFENNSAVVSSTSTIENKNDENIRQSQSTSDKSSKSPPTSIPLKRSTSQTQQAYEDDDAEFFNPAKVKKENLDHPEVGLFPLDIRVGIQL